MPIVCLSLHQLFLFDLRVVTLQGQNPLIRLVLLGLSGLNSQQFNVQTLSLHNILFRVVAPSSLILSLEHVMPDGFLAVMIEEIGKGRQQGFWKPPAIASCLDKIQAPKELLHGNWGREDIAVLQHVLPVDVEEQRDLLLLLVE